jgi:predicted esterase
MTDAIYSEMGQSPEFDQSGSALAAIYDEVTFSEFRHGHYFHYIPSQVDRRKPAPALVFLHGSGGNFKAYAWLLSKVADETGCTVIAPTFGLGNWEKRGAYAAITATITDAGKHAAIDPGQIHLMGLSNGGKGVCLAESQDGPRFRSFVFLSAVFHNRMKASELASRLKPRRVLVLSGGSDDRVPWDYVSGYATQLKSAGLNVTTHIFPHDDHFLFFRKRDEILNLLSAWITSFGRSD